MSVDVVVVGRSPEATGIGLHSRSFLDSLAGYARVVHHDPRRKPAFLAPRSAVSVFCDVIENFRGDVAHRHALRGRLRLAYAVFESDRVPASWVRILETNFDAVAVPSAFVGQSLRASGLAKPIFELPLIIPGTRHVRPTSYVGDDRAPIHFGTVASYHPRKNHRKLIESFVAAFGPSNRDVHLTIHSNLVFGGEYDDLGRLLQARGIENVELSRRCLTEADLLSLMNGFDVFVSASRGEGFAIPVRLAQMMNKLIVAVRTGAVAELDPLNVIWVAAGIRRAAVYPEVNDSVYGHQFDPFKMDLRAALAIAGDLAAARRGKTFDTARAEALIVDNDALAQKYRVLCVPNAVAKGVANRIFADRLEVMDDALLARLRQRPSEHRSRDRSATATQPWQPRIPRP